MLTASEPPRMVDVLVVLGSSDLTVADEAADLWSAVGKPSVVCAGGFGRKTRGWERPEAVAFADRMQALGVPEHLIRLETNSTNTLENAQNVAHMLSSKEASGVLCLVTRPHLRLRARLTFQKVLPAATVVCLAAPGSSGNLPDDAASLVDGEVDRIEKYSLRGDIARPCFPITAGEGWSNASALVAPHTPS